jgi:IclR family transcriptional regulator, KDG regulon repressor
VSEAALSVTRIAALLELFERERRPLTSQEIAKHLEIPRSSLGTLLKALVGLRWLAADRRRATYFPGARLARLTGWLQGEALIDDRLRDAVPRLCRQTGETVSISAAGDLDLEVIHVDSQDVGVQLVVQPGRRMPLWTSAVGTAFLATLPDTTVRLMRARAQRRAACGGQGAPPSLAEVLRRVRATRAAQGIAYASAAVVDGVAAVAVGLPADLGPRPMVLSVGGPSERIAASRASIEKALKQALLALAADAR